jgi:D-alanyl-D-alanine carboxypeptidase
LFGNERWKLKDLLDLTLLESSNDGANAIADNAGRISLAMASGQTAAVSATVPDQVSTEQARQQFVDEMNKKAAEIGLTQTYFLNPTGLDENASVSGGYGSAHDVAILFSNAITKYPELFGVTRYESRTLTSLSNLKHNVKNTNTFVGDLPSLLGSKTGYTDLAGGNLVIAFDAGPNHPIVVSVLGSTEKGRFEAVGAREIKRHRLHSRYQQGSWWSRLLHGAGYITMSGRKPS